MTDFCSCNEWLDIKTNNCSVFKEDINYGWILNWIELTEEDGYTQIHRYGIQINYCPMCGKLLTKETG